MLKKIFWNSIYLFCLLLYPTVFIFNRYFKSSYQKVEGLYCKNRIKKKGKNLWIKGMGTFADPNNIEIGNDCRIGENAYFHCTGGLKIGNNTIISRNVTIYTANHNFHSEEYLPYDNSEIKEKVTIGSNVWIGMNASILPGVRIGDNAIIGMGAIITKDVVENSIVVGNNKVIGYRKKIDQYKEFAKEFPNA